MSVSVLSVLHNCLCGGLSAAGFGVLFNVGFRTLPLCAASGGIALTVRSIALGFGWGFEASSFVAALAVGIAVQLLPPSVGASRNVFHVVGCIPMIPGVFAAKAILGLFATTTASSIQNDTLTGAITFGLRAMFTVGALGTGLAIPALVFRDHEAAQ